MQEKGRTLTIISLSKDSTKYDSQSLSWDVVEHKILNTRNGIYDAHAIKNYAMKDVKSDYILWVDERCENINTRNIEVPSYTSVWTLEDHLHSEPTRVSMFIVPTKEQQLVAWRNIPASDYDVRLRLMDMGCSPLILENRPPTRRWLENAISIRNAYRHRQTLPRDW